MFEITFSHLLSHFRPHHPPLSIPTSFYSSRACPETCHSKFPQCFRKIAGHSSALSSLFFRANFHERFEQYVRPANDLISLINWLAKLEVVARKKNYSGTIKISCILLDARVDNINIGYQKNEMSEKCRNNISMNCLGNITLI